MKTFFKIGGWRDGIQKAVFDETERNPSPDFEESNDQFGREGPRFGAYDDNSIVPPNRESELWIPPPYRNETEEEKAATATTEPPTLPPTRPSLPPPPNTLRPLVATNLQNRAPIPVRTTPARGPFHATQSPPVVRPAQPFGRNNAQPQTVPNQQQQFKHQQTLPQQFIPQQQQQQFIPQPQQQFVPQPQPRPAPTLPPQTPIQRPAPQPAPPRPHPVMSINVPQVQTRRPAPQQRPQTQFRPQAQPATLPQPQNPRPLRPFQQPNNIANQPPRLTSANAAALRTGVCPNTIFYQTTLPAGWELQQTFSHFAMVVSIDQCARTCHEFNCAAAFFDPQTRHCQFNPSTMFSVPQGTCPQWPNPLYRNNIAITSQPLKILCVTCQRRRRNRPGVSSRFFIGQSTTNSQVPRPAPQSVFQTTNHNRFVANSRVANAAAALHGVALEHPSREAIVVDERYGREKMVPQTDGKSLEELDSNSGDSADSNPSAIRTTIVPRLISQLKIQPLKKYPEEENRSITLSPGTDSFRRSRRMTQEAIESAGETKPVLQIA